MAGRRMQEHINPCFVECGPNARLPDLAGQRFAKLVPLKGLTRTDLEPNGPRQRSSSLLPNGIK